MNRARCTLAVLGSLLLANCSGVGVPSGASVGPSSAPVAKTARAADIWLQPKPYAVGATGLLAGGSSDFTSLFSSTTDWPSTAAHTNVFGFYAGWISTIDAATLTTVVDFLSARHIPIEIEAPSLQATATCGSGVEGYAPYGQSLIDFTNAYLGRLKSLGADVGYIKVDEPLFFGSNIPASEPGSCRWPVSQVAQYVAQFVRLVHATYPNAQVGDVEPLIAAGYSTDSETAISGWHDAFATAMGTPFPFFVADMDFGNPAWASLAVQMQQTIRARGERFGIIFIGDPTDTSDAVWASKTLARSQTFAITTGSAPDFVFFQSWDPHPQYTLPETVPTTFTGVVKAYLDSSYPH